MNNCTNSEIQDLLPDLEHGKLSAAMRQSVEEHLAGCESCREDLRVIRTVRSAAVFAPAIDAESVVRQIPPYRMPAPAKEAPARGRVVQWLVAATVGVLLIGGGTLLKNRQADQQPDTLQGAPGQTVYYDVDSQAAAPAVTVTEHTPALALVADTRELSDGNIQQLMDELDDFDALPTSEPEPVFAVDTSEGQ
ncbi:MAG TPA: zf-HC2 domain-containing protein [Gemmatimonadaceae bacterium]|nr:zf-HC2 domain-containing protein [Gemmatimonadaceae bacterium]